MRIAYLVTDPNICLTRANGPTAHINGTIWGMRSHGVEVRVFMAHDYVVRSPVVGSQAPVSAGITPRNRGKLRIMLSDLKRFWRNLKLPDRLAADLRAFDPDVVYERSWLFSFGGLRFARKSGCKYFIETPCCEAEITSESYGLSSIAVANRLEAFKFSRSDCVVTQSVASVELARRKFRLHKPIIAKPLGYDAKALDDFDNVIPSEVSDFCKKYKTVVCFVGTFGRYQGPEFLMKLIKKMSSVEPEIGFLLCGAGGIQEECVGLSKSQHLENVYFTGMVPPNSLSAYMKLTSVGIVPDCDEYMSPIKTLHYGAAGLSVVIPDYVGFDGVVEEGEAGSRFQPKNVESAVAALLSLHGDKKMRDDLGRNFRDHVTKNYSWNGVVREVVSVAREMSKAGE
ncbi:glycosyltransferase [Algibacter sp.]|nr:glycosyltransferase [Algibacter sp.]